jgi:hypothetical protein
MRSAVHSSTRLFILQSSPGWNDAQTRSDLIYIGACIQQPAGASLIHLDVRQAAQ